MEQGFFYHPENITHGKGRIVYAKACNPVFGGPKPEGWALPGGVRTTIRARAYEAAVEIDRLLKQLGAP